MSSSNLKFDRKWIESIILELGDAFDIRILWKKDTLVLAGALAVAGGLIGGYAGGRLGAAVGAGIGGASAFVIVTLRDLWHVIKKKCGELVYIVLNFLRRLDYQDYKKAYNILMASIESRRTLTFLIIDFLVDNLDWQVISSITAS